MSTISTFGRPVQLNLIDEVCPRCLKPSSEVGELHEDDQLCKTCEKEFVDDVADILNAFGFNK